MFCDAIERLKVGGIEGLLKGGRVVRGETLECRPRATAKRVGGFLRGGEVHEFFLVDDLPRMGGWWAAPLVVMAAVVSGQWSVVSGEKRAGGIVWVGRRCWPTLQVMVGAMGEGAIGRSVFLDPLTEEEKFWAIGQALRCGATVMADGSGLTETWSRRLQLAAESGGGERGGVGLLARPAWEMGEESWASGRWEVRPVAEEQVAWEVASCGAGEEFSPRSVTGGMLWEVTSCGAGEDDRIWKVKWNYQVDHGTNAVTVFAGVGRGTGAAAVGGRAAARTA